MNINQNMRIKIQQINIYFLIPNFDEVNRLPVLIYINQNDRAKRFNGKRYYFPKGTIRNCNIIISEKNFYDQSI